MVDSRKKTNRRSALIALVELSQANEETFRSELSQEERRRVGTAEDWSPKEVIAHLAYWKDRQTARVAAMTRGETPGDGPDWGELNAETWPEHSRLTWEESVAHSDQATRDLIAALRDTPQVLWDTIDAEEQPSPGTMMIYTTLGNSLGHVAEHMANHYFHQGDAQRALRTQENAVQAIIDADLGPGQEASARYNLACYCALHGQPANAISELRKAFGGRPDLVQWARQDHDLDSLRADPEFQALVPPEAT